MEQKQEYKRETFKERYNFKCPKCKKELWAGPSIMMTGFGMNQGHGTCPDCKTFFHLEIIPDIYGETMKSEVWDKWLKKQKKTSPKSSGAKKK